MIDLILQLILMISLAVIVYLMAIAVPRVKDDEPLKAESKILNAVSLERMDSFLNSWKGKTLRRLRIYLLKAERSISDQLHKSREIYQSERKKRHLPKLRSIKPTEKLPETADKSES